MKRTIIISVSVLIVFVLIVLGVYLVKSFQGQAPVATSTNPFGFAGNTNTATTSGNAQVSLQLKDGSSVGVQNFVPATQPEWASPTYGYQVTQDETADYSILYYPNNSGFLISLSKEPIGQARADAEKFLETKLRLTSAQLCKLNVQVFTSVDISEAYAGKDLGLSFCPGATVLPQ